MRPLFKNYSNVISNYDLLSPDEEYELFKIIKDENKTLLERDKAREKLIYSNQRLVFSLAKKYSNKKVCYDDLIQEGNMGLIEAIDKFDLDKDCRLSTTAYLWVLQAIRRYVFEDGSIKIPYNQKEDLRRLKESINELRNMYNEIPSIEDIKKFTGYSVKKIKSLMLYEYSFTSLDKELDDGKDLHEVIPSDTISPLEKKVYDERLKIVFNLIDKLPNDHKDAIKLRFGLIDGKEWTFEDIATKIGRSRERTRQIINEDIEEIRARIEF